MVLSHLSGCLCHHTSAKQELARDSLSVNHPRFSGLRIVFHHQTGTAAIHLELERYTPVGFLQFDEWLLAVGVESA